MSSINTTTGATAAPTPTATATAAAPANPPMVITPRNKVIITPDAPARPGYNTGPRTGTVVALPANVTDLSVGARVLIERNAQGDDIETATGHQQAVRNEDIYATFTGGPPPSPAPVTAPGAARHG